jgi:carbamoyltransferase
VEQSGEPELVVAGGVFANVRLNQLVDELPGVGSLFIHPGMGDEGLAYGAACAGALKLDHERALKMAGTPLSDVFLGGNCERQDISEALSAEGLMQDPRPNIEEDIARLLAEGYVVARCAGRMEYGPRALGNRSILYRPDDPSVNDWLNKCLKRTEFMPFAPATPIELIGKMYERAESVRHAAQFMTITRNCTEEGRRLCPGVVHLDGTARPQYLLPEVTPELHKIATVFHELTGLPSIINTSFNIHEEPIVNSPQDAVRAFMEGQLDYLALGDILIEHPALESRPAGKGPARGGASRPAG